MTRVLLVCSKFLPEYSGAGLRAWRTYQRLSRRTDIQIEILCSSGSHFSWRNRRYAFEEVPVTCISSPWKKRYLKKVRLGQHGPKRRVYYALAALDESLRTLIFIFRRARRCDVIHSFGHSFCSGVAIVFGGLWGKRLLRELVTMNSRPDDPPGLRTLTGWALKRRGVIVAISPRLAATARRLGYARVWSRPNPVDLGRFRADPAKKLSHRAQLTGFKAEDVVLLDISKYSLVKNKGLLVRMLPYLPAQYKLVLAGPLADEDRVIYDALQTEIQSLGLNERVALLHGFVDRPEHLMQAADVFLFASTSEGLGTPVLEAICCGLPVVANRLPGVTDVWIRPGYNGYLAGAEPEEFAAAVLRAAELDEARRREAAAALSAQVGTEAVDAIYAKLLQGEPCAF